MNNFLSMQFSLRTKVIFFGLLVILNLILIYPAVPHEIGWDSFRVHTMANSISTFGYAKWWLHPASIVGSYPYAISPSAVPFLLSGISQSSGMNMELSIRPYSMILGILGIFATYLIAGVIWNDELYKFLVAFLFSTSQGIATLSTWTVNARTLFILLLPLFIYLILKTRTFKVRFGVLTIIISGLLLATHHYIYFTIPIIASYFIVIIFYKLNKHIHIKNHVYFANIAIIIAFFIMFIIPFFTRSFMECDPVMLRGGGGRYTWIFYMMIYYTRYIGFLIVFAISGYIYLSFKPKKTFEEWFLLLSLAGIAPFFYMITYAKWFILIFAFLLIGFVSKNITNLAIQNKKYISYMILLLVLSVGFSGYYQFLHFLNEPDTNKRYMEESTYVGALWIKDYIDNDKRMFADPSNDFASRAFSISEVPTLIGSSSDLAYGFINPKELEIQQLHSFLSLEFYTKDPYVTVNHTSTGLLVGRISNTNISSSSSWASRSITLFKISYYAENKYDKSTFGKSIQQTENEVIYDNGKMRVWSI